MIDSASSSSSFSAACMSASMCSFVAGSMFSFSMTFSSRSNTFIAYQRCCSSGRSWTIASSMWASACSTGPEKECCGTVLVDFAASIAAFAASSTPSPLSADICTILQPIWRESSLTLILSPFFFTTSIILMAITTGMPSSVSCVVR